MALLLKTNFNPSFKLLRTGSPIFGLRTGFLEIKSVRKKEITTKIKTIASDQLTPIQFIVSPANAGPKIDAICQVELFQVAAFG